jgi:hypothetical protein
MADHSVEISIKGKWERVPALEVNGHTIVVRGRWMRLAVIDGEEWLESELGDPEACIERLRGQKSRELRADIFTFSQKLPATQPKYHYPMEWESVAATRVTSFTDWWERLPQEGRKNVRRSQKRGVVVSVKKLDDDLISDIVEVNNDFPIRQGVPFAHHGKTRDQVWKDQLSFLERSEFVCAYLGPELIGFLKVVYGREIASLLQILPKASRSAFRPANALIAKAVERCEEKGLAYLTYGRYSYGNKRTTSLMEFKKRNGFEEMFVPRYYVPLTMRGRVALTLKLHPRPERQSRWGLLPQSAIRLGVRLRSRWYAWKLSTGRCSSMAERPKL